MRARIKRPFFLLIIFLLICADVKAVESPNMNILLVTFDTTRADHIGCYGYKGIKTPNIDRFAKEGCLFEKAFTPVPITCPAHSCMLTGVYPPAHGMRNNATFALSDKIVTLPELLKQQGYKTSAFVSSYVLDRRFGLDQGFDVYDDDLITGVEPRMSQKERRAETVTKAAIKWLEGAGKGKFFLWVHYYDPHDAYQPPPPFSKQYADNLYDGEIAYMDYWFGVLLNKFKTIDLLDDTLIVLAGDHGEGLGEHHEKTHGIFIYDSTLWVPLIVRYPKILPKSKRISDLVRLIDITPTILEAIGLKIPSNMQGVSLLPAMKGKTTGCADLTLYCETYYPKSTHNWSPLEGLRTKEWKFIQAPTKELYSLKKDPQERANVFKKEKAKGEGMEKEFAALKEGITPKEKYSTTLEMDEDSREKMRSLGYVWTPTSGEERDEYPDPKEMIGVMEYIDKGADYFAQERYDKAIELFKKVLELDPRNTDGYVILGHAYESMGDDQKSIEAFEHALRLEPENLRIYIQLGTSYMKVGRYKDGLDIFSKAIDLNPRCKEAYANIALYHFRKEEWSKAEEFFKKALDEDPEDLSAHNYLSVIYQRQGEHVKAIQEAEDVLVKDPNNSTALLNLGSVYQSIKRINDAQDVLERAVRIKPDYGDAYYFLGVVYFQQNNMPDAIDAFEKAIKHDSKKAESHFNLGYIYLQYKDIKKAKKEFEAALDLKADFIQAREMLQRIDMTIPR